MPVGVVIITVDTCVRHKHDHLHKLRTGAGGGGSITTYRELCSMATDLGKPELVYKFMDLAHHAAALKSKRGAAFSVASIAGQSLELLQPHVAALLPKLYRYSCAPFTGQPNSSQALRQTGA
jgi:hypothetical protein